MGSSTDSASTVLVNSVTSYATTVNIISAPSESNVSVPMTSATPQRSNRLRRLCRSDRLRVRRLNSETTTVPMTPASMAASNLCSPGPVSYTHLRAHETRHDLVCRLLLEK